MLKQLELPRVGAKILEGVANGFNINEMRNALVQSPGDLPLDTLKQYTKATYRALYIAPRPDGSGRHYAVPSSRGVGLCIAAGLLQSTDLQAPGEKLQFTMAPSPDCPIRYVDTYTCGQSPHTWPSQPLHDMRIPGGPPSPPCESLQITAQTRSYLVAALLGMSSREMQNRRIIGSSYYRMDVVKQAQRIGLGNTVQFAAHCAAAGVIEIPQEILDPTALVEPITYTCAATLDLPVGGAKQPEGPAFSPTQPPSQTPPYSNEHS